VDAVVMLNVTGEPAVVAAGLATSVGTMRAPTLTLVVTAVAEPAVAVTVAVAVVVNCVDAVPFPSVVTVPLESVP